MSTKHSPGPWEAHGGGVNPPDGRLVAEVNVTQKSSSLQLKRVEWEANARLIAAAPDMLESLKTARRAAQRYLGVCPESMRRSAINDLNEIEHSIKKAESA